MYLEIDKLLEHLYSFNESTNEDEIDELTEIAEFIMDLGGGLTPKLRLFLNETSEENLIAINYLIDKIDVKKMKTIYSCGILRYTNTLKDKLNNWYILRDSIYQNCLDKGINPNDGLYGLYGLMEFKNARN